MASKRCGCASDSCSCVVTGGEGIEVTGTGSKTNPYVVDMAVEGTLDVTDENTLIRSGVSVLDFQGGGITATAGDPGEVIVTVPTIPPPGLSNVTVQRFVYQTVGSATWTKPANCLSVLVYVQGAGGGGAGAQATASGQVVCGGAGGGGGHCFRFFNASELADTEPVVVGGGGAGGPASQTSGAAGEASSFGQSTYLMTALGGGGGSQMPVQTSNAQAQGGDGGSASGGTVNMPGGDGTNGRTLGTTPISPMPGPGGDSFFGGAQRATYVLGSTGAAGSNGTNWGGGGTAGYAFASQAGFGGGAGAQGLVVVIAYVGTSGTLLSSPLEQVAAGRVSVPLINTGVGAVAVTFPVGRFVDPPAAIAAINTSVPSFIAAAANPTTTGVVVVAFHRDLANVTADIPVSWFARVPG